jgi:integrase
MGHARKRPGLDGRPRYTAYYDDLSGRRRSAGTFTTRKEADAAWRRAEIRLAEGRVGDPARGRQTFAHYVRDDWFPNHVIEATTRQSYSYVLERHILPHLGGMRMAEILPSHVREWVATLRREGANPPTIRYCKVIVDAVFTTALNDQVTFLHPGKGVKTPPVAKRPRRIITPAQFDALLDAIDGPTMQLLVETDIETGLRWGELTELRPRDFDFATGVLTVARVAVELSPKFHPEGKRFLVKDYPKDKEWRGFRVSDHLLDKIKSHIATLGLGPDDLLFVQNQPTQPRRSIPAQLPDPQTLGWTEPNALGRRYRHGTPTAYGAGRCRCEHCRNSVAAYRASRRASGKDHPRKRRTVDTDGHIGRGWFRKQIWRKALSTADIPLGITPHDLRHAHASWVLAGGADLQVVKERLGHASITTTEKYLHTLPETEDAAVNALARIRAQRRPAD